MRQYINTRAEPSGVVIVVPISVAAAFLSDDNHQMDDSVDAYPTEVFIVDGGSLNVKWVGEYSDHSLKVPDIASCKYLRSVVGWEPI